MKKIRDYPESWLVAHRGDHEEHVENTLNAFKQAAESGAQFAECDIQFTRDLVPVVIHDNHLKRLCDLDLHVSMLDLIDLKELCYPYFKLLTLQKLIIWLEQKPQLSLFIEVKPDILERTSSHTAAALVKRHIPEAIIPQIVLISTSVSILNACISELACRIGWVAEGTEQPATTPDYIFMPYSDAADIRKWHDKGAEVGLYTINDAGLAEEMCKLGADLIETDHFTRIFNELQQSRDDA
jgi:glycerophosphoryl diester phosphodiesterase